MAAPRPRTASLVLAGWTGFVWVTRLANVLGDDDLDTAGQIGGVALALSFVVLAAAVAWAALTRRDVLFRAVAALTVWTVAVWAVRVVGITDGDHSIGFVVVHLLLAAVSLALCVVALRELVGDRHGFLGRHPDK